MNVNALNLQAYSFDTFRIKSSEMCWFVLATVMILIGFGLIMVASSSIDHAASKYSDPWMFARKQTSYMVMGLALGFVLLNVPMQVWNKLSGVFLVLALLILVLVLIPGIGREVNGGRRWLAFGPIGFQASELGKMFLLIFYASFLARRAEMVSHRWSTFAIMVGIVGVTALLLLMEPDFGSVVIVCVMLGSMMFVAGVPVLRFVLLAATGLGSAIYILKSSSWRMDRITIYLDPFSDPYDKGYQLVNSLIAFGRGEWFGLGLGNSIQKLFFLPDSHTDFIFAIIFEELGLVGTAAFIGVFSLFIGMLFRISKRAYVRGDRFGSYLVLGIAVMFASQAFVNMGVATGLLPTKGLTLPFVSYGGSSLLIACLLVAIAFRVNVENLRGEPV
jgi:cell division protein FtsW